MTDFQNWWALSGSRQPDLHTHEDAARAAWAAAKGVEQASQPQPQEEIREGHPDWFCQWCYDRGLRYSHREGPWPHALGCPNRK